MQDQINLNDTVEIKLDSIESKNQESEQPENVKSDSAESATRCNSS